MQQSGHAAPSTTAADIIAVRDALHRLLTATEGGPCPGAQLASDEVSDVENVGARTSSSHDGWLPAAADTERHTAAATAAAVMTFNIPPGAAHLADMFEWLEQRQQDGMIASYALHQATLESVFLRVSAAAHVQAAHN